MLRRPVSWLTASFTPVLCLALGGCSDGSNGDGEPGSSGGAGGTAGAAGGSATLDVDPTVRGPLAVGTRAVSISAGADRDLTVQLWYPATEEARAEETAGHPLELLEIDSTRRATLEPLVRDAPDGCTRKTLRSAIDAPLLGGDTRLPLVLFSHCHSCARFSEAVVAERLASWGFVVAAPDHVGNTLYEELQGTSAAINEEFLRVRAADIRAVLDAILDGTAPLPAEFEGRFDSEAVGMFGHSYGSVTTGLVLETDDRVQAGAMIAAPPENPLIPGVTLANLSQPALFVLAEEDNSITELGNALIRTNFADYPNRAHLVSVKDAGHWSFSDICALIGLLTPGCGTAMRQTDPAVEFDYLDNETGREVASRYVTAFFALELLGDTGAGAELDRATPSDVVTIDSHD